MPSIWIDFDLSNVSEQDLLCELEERWLDEDDKERLAKILHSGEQGRKIELFLKVKDKFSLLELEELFKEQALPAIAPKEQLKLEM